MKKILLFVLTSLTVLTLVACKADVTVTFDSQGGSVVDAISLKAGDIASEPATAPTKEGLVFGGWFTEAECLNLFQFSTTKIEESIMLFAKWTLGSIRFVDHRFGNTTTVEISANGEYDVPAALPNQGGMKHVGWFSTRRGLTWTELAPIDFSNFELDEDGLTEVYAGWEPVDSKGFNWPDSDTYFQTMDGNNPMAFDPFNYSWETEDIIIDYLSTPLYTQEVDWDSAVKEGYADFPGDFSKFGVVGEDEGAISIDLLKYKWILAGALSYPKNSAGADLVQEDGSWDRDAAASFTDYKWTVEIRHDLTWHDGTPITADDYIYTYKQFIDPIQANTRGEALVPNSDYSNGYAIVNAKAYRSQGVTGVAVDWSEVGLKKLDDYTLELNFEQSYVDGTGKTVSVAPAAQTTAVGFMNMLRLVRESVYEESLNNAKDQSSYGTSSYPYESYGSYVIKSWDEGQKLILNKNYNYVLKGQINFKSISYQFTTTVDQNMNLFKDGQLSSVGLLAEYYAEYAEAPNKYPTYGGTPFMIELNVTDARDDSRPANPLVKDISFRQAVLFGVDRNKFTQTVFAPNTPSLMTWPIEAKQYASDPMWYKDSDEHEAVLSEFGLNDETHGYDPVRAKALFDEAYARWDETHDGKVILSGVTRNDERFRGFAKFFEDELEALFGADKIDIQWEFPENAVLLAHLDNRDFDISLLYSGWGHAQLSFVYLPLLGLYYNDLLGALDANDYESYDGLAEEVATVDLRNTYEYMIELVANGDIDETTDNGFAMELFGILEENDGYYVGSVYDLFYYGAADGTLWASEEPRYEGAVEDLTRITAAFERLIFKYVTYVPVASATPTTLFAENVKIEWPFYSYEMGWGSMRYRYLTTDIDFQ